MPGVCGIQACGLARRHRQALSGGPRSQHTRVCLGHCKFRPSLRERRRRKTGANMTFCRILRRNVVAALTYVSPQVLKCTYNHFISTDLCCNLQAHAPAQWWGANLSSCGVVGVQGGLRVCLLACAYKKTIDQVHIRCVTYAARQTWKRSARSGRRNLHIANEPSALPLPAGPASTAAATTSAASMERVKARRDCMLGAARTAPQ
jgi:hypothetical protein